MTPTEQDKELRALLGEMPYFVIDWLELSEDLRNEWKKGGKASDFGGQRTFIQKYEKKLADFITADRKRVALEARLEALDHIIDLQSKQFNRWTQKDIANFFNGVGKYYRELKAQQEEV